MLNPKTPISATGRNLHNSLGCRTEYNVDETMQKEELFTPITVGIMGGSASGKTTFASALAEALSEFSPVVLNQDSYFRDWSEYSDAERERVITANHHRHQETTRTRRY